MKKIEPIKVDIKNETYMTSVSVFVDNIKFLQAVRKLREKWGIEKLYRPKQYKDFYAFIWGDKNNGEQRWEEFMSDIQRIRINFNRTPNYDKVVLYATAFTEIPDSAFKTTYLKSIHNPKNDDIEYTIAVTPHTTPEELSSELKTFKKMIKDHLDGNINKVKESEMFGYEYEPGPKYLNFADKPNLDDIREWYWLRYRDVINKLSDKPTTTYPQILAEWNNKCRYATDELPENHSCKYCSLEDQNIIEKAVLTYHKNTISQ